ncbi:hypothetical protein D9M72_527080 [compost metagenome]
MSGVRKQAGKTQAVGGGDPCAQIERCRTIGFEADATEANVDLEEHADLDAVSVGGFRQRIDTRFARRNRTQLDAPCLYHRQQAIE